MNFPQQDITNGLCGVIKYIGTKSLVVDTRHGQLKIDPSMTEYLKPSYALTVHKAQGSGFDKVVFLWIDGDVTHSDFVYTALSRAKKVLKIFTQGNSLAVTASKTRRTLYDII